MLLPDARRRGEIHFALAKGLSYRARLAVIAALLAAGLAVQVLLSLGLGAVLLLAASLLAVVQGYRNVPEGFAGRREWRGAERAQLQQVLTLDRKSHQWDESALDVTCATGAACLLAVIAGTALVAFVLWSSRLPWLATAFVVDVLVLLAPHWVTGVRRILTNDPLTVKVRLLLSVMDDWQAHRREGETIAPQMEVRRGSKGEMPCDAKLVLQVAPLGEHFLGLQVQVVLNNVQGRDYPYLYCVLVARPEMEMLPRIRHRPPADIVVEPKHQGDVDIVVVRNKTTKGGGYHTPAHRSREIFQHALKQVRSLLHD